MLSWRPTVASLLLVLTISVEVETTSVPQARDQSDQAAQGTANVSGIAIDNVTRRPLARVRVQLEQPRAAGGGVVLTTMTDQTGRFELQQLRPGTYELVATLAGYTPLRYGQKAPGRDLTLVMVRGGAISGLVFDPGGQPSTGSVVSALRRRFSDRGPVLEPASTATVDDRGQYRIFGLEPGEYLVLARPPAMERLYGATAAQLSLLDGLSATFHPGTLASNQATIVALTAAEERSGVDITMPVGGSGTVTGVVKMPGGQPAPGGRVTLYREDELRIAGVDPPFAYFGTDGRFVLSNVAVGTYVIAAISELSAPGGLATGAGRVTVTNATPTVSIIIQSGVTVSGRLVFPAGAPPPVQVLLTPIGVSNGLGDQLFINSQVDAQGRFNLRSVPAGSYRVSLGGPAGGVTRDPGGRVLSAPDFVRYQGRDISDLPFDVGTSDIADLEVVFTNTPTEVAGTAHDLDGRPLTDGTVIVFPADRRRWIPGAGYGIRATTPDANGAFRFLALAAGDYLVVAVKEVEPNQWFDTQYLDRISPSASRLSLNRGERRSTDIRAIQK